MQKKTTAKLGFIGAGKMGEALIGSIIKARLFPAKNIMAYDINRRRLDTLQKAYRIHVTMNLSKILEQAGLIVLAVKPQVMRKILSEIGSDSRKDQIFISIAAGIQLKALMKALPDSKVVRVMPNTPCLVGEMAAGYTFGPGFSRIQKQAVQAVLNAAGLAIEMPERYLDAVTAIAGSGPAFVAYLIQAITNAGKKQKLPAEIAYRLTLQTFKGTAVLLDHSNLTPADLIEMVSSPGGTTVAGREILEKSHVGKIIDETVKKAAQRSKALGKISRSPR